MNEQAAQAGRLNAIIGEVGMRAAYLESLLLEARSQNFEYSQLLSGSVTSIFALEGEVSTLRHNMLMKDEEVAKASSVNEELKSCWQSALAINASLHERLVSSETLAQSRISSDLEIVMKNW